MDYTVEMAEYFNKRTKEHVSLVRQYAMEIINKINIKEYGVFDVSGHDISKFGSPEFIPYIYLTWKTKCADENIDFLISDEISGNIKKAITHHYKHNKHHPEFWDNNFKFGQIVDATSMTFPYIMEMVADWMAVSHERQTSLKSFMSNTINKRWKFDKEQEGLIYEIVEKVWKKD